MQTLVIWQYRIFTMIVFLKFVFSATDVVTNIKVEGNPIKGQHVVIVCSIANSSRNAVFVRKGNTTYTVRPMVLCNYENVCVQTNPYSNRYRFTSNSSSITITIQGLNRAEDEEYWECTEYNRNPFSQGVWLTIYTAPQAVTLSASPNRDIDLSVESISLTCVTINCVYPSPTFTWYFTENGASLQQYINMTGTSTVSSCTDKEEIYTSNLILPVNTAYGNQQSPVQFQCSILSFPGLQTQLNTTWSKYISFAVLATTPTLNNKTADGLVMLADVANSLTCTTSFTRPAAKVTWRKGNVFLENVHYLTPNRNYGLVSVTSIVTFTPQRSDNSTNIVCITAIPGQVQPTSEQGTLMILWPPSIPTITLSDRFPWQEGSSYSLNCSTTSQQGNPAAAVTWNSKFETQDSSNPWKLIFNNVSYEQDDVNVSCQLNNGYTARTGAIVQTAVTLNINFPCKVLNASNRHTVALGGSVNFSILCYCKPKQLNSVSITSLDKTNFISRFAVSWIPYPVDATLHDRVVARSIYIQINNVTQKDFGIYVLALMNAAGTTMWPFIIESYHQEDICSNTHTEAIVAGIVSSIVVGVTCIIISVLLTKRYLAKTKDTSHKYEDMPADQKDLPVYESLEQETKRNSDHTTM